MEIKKVKEMKDDALLNVKVNKTYYQMAKAALLTLLQDVYSTEKGNPDTFVKDLVSKEYKDQTDKERAFYTLTLLVGEIEKQAVENDAYFEKEIDPEKFKEDLEKSENSNEG